MGSDRWRKAGAAVVLLLLLLLFSMSLLPTLPFSTMLECRKKKLPGTRRKGRKGKERDPASHRAGILFIIASSNPFFLPPWQITLSSIMKLGFSAPCVSPISCLRTPPPHQGEKAIAKFLSRLENCPGPDGGESSESVCEKRDVEKKAFTKD